MTSLKAFLRRASRLLGAVLLAPFVVLVGLMTFGFVLGLLVISAGALVAFGPRADTATVKDFQPAI